MDSQNSNSNITATNVNELTPLVAVGDAKESKTNIDPKDPSSDHDKIGMLGSIAIAVNSLTGPAMLTLPATFQRSGLIPTIATLIFVCILSAQCSLSMASVISKVPGNRNFKKEIEFSEAFQVFWGYKWFVFTQVVFLCCVTCLNVSSIIDTSQVVDTFLGHHVPGGSAALQFLSSDIRFVRWDPTNCTVEELREGDCIPFLEAQGLLLTAGYLLSGMAFLPLCLMDLKENALMQVFGFIVLLATTVQFTISFLWSGLEFERMSLWGDSWASLFGVVMFNFALVIVVPAWLYEKDQAVDAPTVIYGSSVMATIMYILIGCAGALALPNVSDNMLESMMSGTSGPVISIGATIFAFFIIGLGIPLFSVLARMSLTGTKLCSKNVANAIAVYLPWLFSWLLYREVTGLLAWGGVLFTSVVAFILPLLLALHTVLEYDEDGSISLYGQWIATKRTQSIVLLILLVLSIIAVVISIYGLIVGD